MRKPILILLLINFCFFFANSQHTEKENWTIQEVKYYEVLCGLAEYVYKKPKSKISKDTLYSKYIYFDNVLNDSDPVRRERRLVEFDTIFSHIPRKIDSIGLENLDAKPIRFYKVHQIFKPFEKALSGTEKDVLAYYNKDKPNEPLGTLLFEEDSGKL